MNGLPAWTPSLNRLDSAAPSYPPAQLRLELQDIPLTIDHSRHGDAEFSVGGGDAAWLVLIISEGQTAERKVAGVWSHRVARVGLVTVTNPDELTQFSIRGQANVARLLIPLSSIASQMESQSRLNVKARFEETEPNLERCAKRALVAMRQGRAVDPLFSSSLMLDLSRTLVEQPLRGDARAIGGLSRRQLRRVEELIESRVSAPVATNPSLSELAAHADLSVHHFAREFHRTTGATPYGYMLRRRLERARRLVVASVIPLARVGALAGFSSPAHFADRFRREMGVSPSALRRAAQA